MTLQLNNADGVSCISEYPGRHWGFAMVRPRSEKMVAAKAAAAGVPCYLPLLTKLRCYAHGNAESIIPMFGGYVFLCLSYDERTFLARNSEVRRIIVLQDADEEQLIKELNSVRKCELLAREQKLVVNHGLHPGDKVVCTAGILKGEEVIIDKRTDEFTMIVNWYCFDRHCVLQYEAADLQHI